MKVLHVLEKSLPDTGGYTIRARAILEQQRRDGLDPVVVTSPLMPLPDSSVRSEVLFGIRHHRTSYIPTPAQAPHKLASYAYRVSMMRRYRAAVMEIVAAERPDVIHAHSSYLNPLASLPAARRFGLPLVYEVRTLWGESAVVEDGLDTQSWKYKMVWWLELKAMRQADAVVPIARAIQDELARRGIDAAKMTVVPNGVDSGRFVPRARDEERARTYGLQGKFVVGFIGTMRRLEGLSTLVEAYAALGARRSQIALVLVGDGPDRPDLLRLAQRLGLGEILFTGNVPHEEVASWYSVMDVVVYPRIRATINERVTPLKPLETMALGKVCIASDVGGLLELVRDDETGVIFAAGDAPALARAITALADDPRRLERLGAAGLEYVRRERDWSAIIPRTRQLYEQLIGARARVGRR
ncbi:MAG: glycosyltransferase [Proteobacteria bacterium]|nr:glycosyltransferase [Pseudomonadota bacterium]